VPSEGDKPDISEVKLEFTYRPESNACEAPGYVISAWQRTYARNCSSPPESESWTDNKEKMVSRRAILSRSRDDLANDSHPEMFSSHSEDQWFSKEKLYKDHIIEVLSKWDSIDDEIWAKVIVLERNRRIAKAYARAPVLTVNGSEDGFDGFRIGVNGFDNPLRDNKTLEFKEQIGKGCKLKMDDSGNILVKRLSRSNIYVKNTMEENAVRNPKQLVNCSIKCLLGQQ